MELPHRHPIALIDEHRIINDEEVEATGRGEGQAGTGSKGGCRPGRR